MTRYRMLTLNLVAMVCCLPTHWALQGTLRAQEATAEETTVESSNVASIRELIYGHKAGMALTYDLIRPAENDNGAAVVFVVSGGWRSTYFLPRNFQRLSLLRKLNEQGYSLILLRHGSAPRFKVPEAVDDVKQALRHIRFHAEKFGFDPERIGICGASAGGHLSLMLGTTGEDGQSSAKSFREAGNRVACVAAWFPPTDLRSMVGPNERFPALDFDKELGDDVSPLVHVTEDDAPTLLVHGTRDQLVPIKHSESIKAKFDEVGIACELVTLEGAGHGFRGDHAEQADEAVVNWFNKYLLNKESNSSNSNSDNSDGDQ